MPTYLSPGVYVEEIPSGSAPIAALSTSTAGFIGIVANTITIPISPIIQHIDDFKPKTDQKDFTLKNFPVSENKETYEIFVGSTKKSEKDFTLTVDTDKKATISFTSAPTKTVKVKYIVLSKKVTNEKILTINKDTDVSTEKKWSGTLKNYPVNKHIDTWDIKANGITLGKTKTKIDLDDTNRVAKVTISSADLDATLRTNNKITNSLTITADYQVTFPTFSPVTASEVKLCTNFNEFKKYFGDFSTDKKQKLLAHAVYGFFNNGGSRCYVSRVTDSNGIPGVLEKFEAIDEIALVAAPGITDKSTRSAIVTHCQNMGDRFAILDCDKSKKSSDVNDDKPDNTDYAAYYFPWIKVSDPVKKIMNPNAKDEELWLSVPPSGHIAGVYARVDTQRGVHKAPANEVVLGALGLDHKISKNQQDGLNPQGINCIRELNGNIRIWGARTIGGDANGEFKYINVRRLFLSLRDSIDKNTQWTVFEPNDTELWAKIKRNVNAYLTNVWRSGALFGTTPQDAFYVKCDAENNPPEVRDLGQVIIEIGVAPVKPAEFVIFRLSQWAGSGQ